MATMVNNLASSARARAGEVVGKASETLDYRFPPQKRQEVQDRAQAFAGQNPKLATLLSLLLLLTVPPFLLFLAFVTTMLITSIVICISLALTVALTFTSLCFGGALLLLLPSLGIGAIVAVGIWFWTLVAIWVGGKFGVFSAEFTNQALGSEEATGDARGTISNSFQSNLNSIIGIIDLFIGSTPLDASSPDLQKENGTESQLDRNAPSTLAQIEKNPNVAFAKEQVQKARNKYGPQQTEIRTGREAGADQDVPAPIGVQSDVRHLVKQESAS